jgi:hypothetical protein
MVTSLHVRGLDVQCLDDRKVGLEQAAEATIDDSIQFSCPLQNAMGRLWVIRSDSTSHVLRRLNATHKSLILKHIANIQLLFDTSNIRREEL